VSLFDEARSRLWGIVEPLSGAQLRIPNADGWSVLHVLEHLALMESQVASKLADAMRQPAGERIPVKQEANRFMLDRTHKFRAPEFGIPQGEYSSLAEARAGLAVSRDRIEAVLAMAGDEDDLYTHGLAFPVPAIGTLSVGQWYDFLACHEMRHAAQIEDMKTEWPGGTVLLSAD
jgi:hypothetical protein